MDPKINISRPELVILQRPEGSIYLALSENNDTSALKAFDQKHSLSSSFNKNGRFPAINDNNNNNKKNNVIWIPFHEVALSPQMAFMIFIELGKKKEKELFTFLEALEKMHCVVGVCCEIIFVTITERNKVIHLLYT